MNHLDTLGGCAVSPMLPKVVLAVNRCTCGEQVVLCCVRLYLEHFSNTVAHLKHTQSTLFVDMEITE